MYLKKRISKKLHKKFLNDVVYEISLSSLWKKRLFEDNEEDLEHEYKLKRFVFVATKHPMIFSDSLNNPDVI